MKQFRLITQDGLARRGEFRTTHGVFQTPAFMPVGTQASVKGVTPSELRDLGAQIILSNTYHIHLRPGDELVRDLGGLHKFMGWQGPILTDSGGYQVFSLAKLRKITEEGVSFQSHIDGTRIMFTPEKVVQIQENLGVDIMMVLDECLPYPASESDAEKSLALTLNWAKRSQLARTKRETVSAFGIVQGGMYPELRKRAVEGLLECEFDGYSIGGLSVGEPVNLMREMTALSAELLPQSEIRYLMGVGTPLDIVESVALGIDLFDCVIPTRSARFGRLYTRRGSINIRNTQYRSDSEPIDSGCGCYCCTNFSRAYLSHLVHAKEVLAVTLGSIHNLHFYQQLMRDIRAALEEKRFAQFLANFVGNYSGDSDETE